MQGRAVDPDLGSQIQLSTAKKAVRYYSTLGYGSFAPKMRMGDSQVWRKNHLEPTQNQAIARFMDYSNLVTSPLKEVSIYWMFSLMERFGLGSHSGQTSKTIHNPPQMIVYTVLIAQSQLSDGFLNEINLIF